MHEAIIFRPTKSATQSGQRTNTPWRLAFHTPSYIHIDPVMHWISQVDTRQEVVLQFTTREAAIAYAKKQKLIYIVQESPPTPPQHPHSYQEHLLKPHIRS